jgi:hypothetical protein
MNIKILFASAAVVLLAAGCSSSQTSDAGTAAQMADSGSPAAMQSTPTPTAMPTEAMVSSATQAQVNAEVSSPNDAVSLLLKDSSNEQTSVGTSDDSDLTSSDSANLNSFTGVSNGY